jgi:ankyrin repeat protein
LSYAAANDRLEVVKLLLAHPGIDVNMKNEVGRTPLDSAKGKAKRLIAAAGGKTGKD